MFKSKLMFHIAFVVIQLVCQEFVPSHAALPASPLHPPRIPDAPQGAFYGRSTAERTWRDRPVVGNMEEIRGFRGIAPHPDKHALQLVQHGSQDNEGRQSKINLSEDKQTWPCDTVRSSPHYADWASLMVGDLPQPVNRSG